MSRLLRVSARAKPPVPILPRMFCWREAVALESWLPLTYPMSLPRGVSTHWKILEGGGGAHMRCNFNPPM
jgi:hypothetical protein